MFTEEKLRAADEDERRGVKACVAVERYMQTRGMRANIATVYLLYVQSGHVLRLYIVVVVKKERKFHRQCQLPTCQCVLWRWKKKAFFRSCIHPC
jgi:hypothetical protein